MSFGDVRSYCHNVDPDQHEQKLMDILRSCDDVNPLYAVQYVVDQGFGHMLAVDRWRCQPIDGRTQVPGPFVEDSNMYDISADVWINGHFIHIFDVTHMDVWTWYRAQIESYLSSFDGQNQDMTFRIKPSVFLDRVEAGLQQYNDFDLSSFNQEIRECRGWYSDNFLYLGHIIRNPDAALLLLEVLKRNLRWPYIHVREQDNVKKAFNMWFTQHMLATKTINPKETMSCY